MSGSTWNGRATALEQPQVASWGQLLGAARRAYCTAQADAAAHRAVEVDAQVPEQRSTTA